MTHKVFVYGSLKTGLHNHWLLENSKFIEFAQTQDSVFEMVSFDSFPGVLENGSFAIQGELYEVEDEVLEWLDQLEGNGSFYQRKITLLANGQRAWMYVLLRTPVFVIQTKKGIKLGRKGVKSWEPFDGCLPTIHSV